MPLDDKIKLIEKAPDNFITGVEKLQNKVFKDILKELNSLKRDSTGKIELSLANIAKIEPIAEKLRDAITKGGYTDLVKKLGLDLDKVKAMTDDYLIEAFDAEKTKVLDALYEQVKNDSLNTLANAAVDRNVSTFKSLLQDSIAQSDSYTNLIDNIQTNILGNDKVDGKMLSYAKQNAKDAFSTTERTYTTVLADSIGIEFYSYSGGEMDTTREFCSERVNKIWHYKEIEAWASKSWEGKASGTDKKTIFTLLGGYNCQHSLIPIGLDDVPKSVLLRNIENGNVNKEDLPAKVLKRIGLAA